MSNVNIHQTDVIEFLKNYSGPKFHAVLSDPPYGLAFMGKAWDKYTPKQYQEWVTQWASLLLEHLYPGAVCMFFGGTRTYHRLATGLEDAGFEVFDSMIWCYGSGFPKSYNISKGIDKELPRRGMFDKFAEHYKQQRELKGFTHNYICGIGNFYENHNHGGASTNWERGYNVPTLKQWKILQPLLELSMGFLPLIERIELERNKIGEKEVINGSIFRNFEENPLTGKKQIDVTENNSDLAHQWNGYGTALKPAFEPVVLCRKPRSGNTFVDCVLEYGTGALNVDGTRIVTQDETRRIKSGYQQNGYVGGDYSTKIYDAFENRENIGRFPANLGLICDCECEPCECDYQTIGDSARFFYTAKSSRKERNLGLDHLPETETQVTGWSGDGTPLRQNGTERKMPMAQNTHPTVKPIKLTEYLSTMLLPPIENSSILIPFSGSGSEVIGAMLAKWSIITSLEIDENYIQIQENRVQYWKGYNTYDLAMKGK